MKTNGEVKFSFKWKFAICSYEYSIEITLIPQATSLPQCERASYGRQHLRSVYARRQRCDNFVITLAILFSLKTIESFENGLQPPFWIDSIVKARLHYASMIDLEAQRLGVND